MAVAGTVGARLRELRQQRGLSLRGLARRMNMAHATLSKYETGKQQIDADLLFDFGERLNVDPCAFLRPEPPQAAAPSQADRDAGTVIRALTRLSDDERQRFLNFLQVRAEMAD